MTIKKKLNPSDIKIGDKITPLKVRIENETYKKYNRLINEINPLHYNKRYAEKIGFKDIVVAGNFTFSYIPKTIIDWLGDIKPMEIKVQFESPVYIGDEIIHTGKVTKKYNENDKILVVECEYMVEKINGERVTSGTAKILFPS